MEMPTARARPSLFDLVAASSFAEREPPLRHELAQDDDVDSTFSALLAAISTASPLPTSPPTTANSECSSTADDKQTQRRERNRLSCRKARLKRKLERLSQSLVVQRREERQAELLDLRDQLSAAAAATAVSPLRAFVAKSLHYALLDDEYMAAKQRATASERLRLGWPTRALTSSMVKQWQRITSDVMNPQLTIDEIKQVGRATAKAAVVRCQWTLRGVSLHGVEARCREEPTQHDGTTELRFINGAVTSIQLSATAVKIEAEDDDYDDDSEPEAEDEAAYTVAV